ncbi:uncharacterized protein PGTG_22627 [Puccinia graminis f. sp. tritici CRL 75-36-700-3]|uniref:No apical meristem-associated C-terminal domain-containing protein n=1 Tax=Puccinia graminis f. sp. tritici (strain CRL 75-36-700-3 / race SCCL) TaxID=418459 RepID=H6QV58_PUCGT|nr:uncharacterized protein PGTG_22627 [Puccinia graminis f. sp. tritici CRL 75-36-700-3]EHS62719.1 hypothetical protein PGTG_22627 [Puccinia graminis f. sp. tritici CRL 75-36-700-3]
MARGPNWLSKEDAQLARSWLHTSQNPIYANAMKRDQFWEHAAEHFNENSPGGHREGKDLSTRWAKLRAAVTKFCGIYASIKRNPPSGSETLDWLSQAKTLFSNQTGKPFVFESAWMELRDAPKWQILLDKTPAPTLLPNSQSQSGSPAPPQSSGTVPNPPNTPTSEQAANSPSANDGRRPTGVKAAKRALTQNEFLQKKLKLMETSAKESRDLSQKRFQEMSRANDLQEKVVDMDILSKDLSMCVDEFERAYYTRAKKDILKKLEEAKNQPPPPPPTNDQAPSSSTNLESQDDGTKSLASSHRDPLNLTSEPNESQVDDKEEGAEDHDGPVGDACDNLNIDPAFL